MTHRIVTRRSEGDSEDGQKMFIIPQETGREWRLTRDSFEDTGVASLSSRTDTNSDEDKQLAKSRRRMQSRARASHRRISQERHGAATRHPPPASTP